MYIYVYIYIIHIFIYINIYMGGLHQLVTVGKKSWFWIFWDLDTK